VTIWVHLWGSRTARACSEHDVSPYGELFSSTASDRLLFTQHERDGENGSDSALFRQYASAQGRWLSPDPYNGSYNLADPQSLNRYTYVNGRPLAAVDRDGLFLNGLGDGGDGGGVWGGLLGLFGLFGLFGGGGGGHHAGPPSTVDTGYGSPDDPNGSVVYPPYVTQQSSDPGSLGESLGIPKSIPHGVWGIGPALGLPSTECDFGACGSSFTDPNQIEQHHIFAQQFAQWFRDRNLDEALIRLTVPLTAAAHRLRSGPGVHTSEGGNWNNAWRRWIQDNPNATPQQIVKQAKQFLVDFGIAAGDTLSDVFVSVDPCVLDPSASYCGRGPYN
jgi:RHS repeat-associated protein